MDSVWTRLIEGIHASGKKLVIVITGGGSEAIGELLKVPGGSQSLLEAMVPYSAAALDDFLGGRPDHYCSEPTCRAMAMAAWMRTRELESDADPASLVGIGVTASLVSNVPKRGEHRIHMGLQTANETATLSLTLDKGTRNREQEEHLASRLILLALADACGVKNQDARDALAGHLHADEVIQHRSQKAEPEWTQLLLGQVPYVVQSSNSEKTPRVIFPGAFNPLHEGHREMAHLAERRLGNEVYYEISITNVDKPPLEFIEIQNRLDGIKQGDASWELLLTTAPTFREKAKLFPGATFLVGIDTLVRIGDPRYYDNDQRLRDEAIAEIAKAGCRFLVFGRVVEGNFRGLEDAKLPGELVALCDDVPEGEFRADVCSSELRSHD